MRLPDYIVAALDATDMPYTVEVGGKHAKVRIDGHLVLVVSHGGSGSGRGGHARERKNCEGNIRRAAAAIRRGERPR